MYNVLFKGKFEQNRSVFSWVGDESLLQDYEILKKAETDFYKVVAFVRNKKGFDIVLITDVIKLTTKKEIENYQNYKEVVLLWLDNPYRVVKKYGYKSNEIDILSPTSKVKYTIKDALSKGFKRDNCYSNSRYIVEQIGHELDRNYVIKTDEFRTTKHPLEDSLSFIIKGLEIQYYITEFNRLQFGLWNGRMRSGTKEEQRYSYDSFERGMRYGIKFKEIIFYTNNQKVVYSWRRFYTMIHENDAKIIIKLVEKDLLKSFLVNKIN